MSTPPTVGNAPDEYDTIYEEIDPDTGAKEFKSRISNLDQQAIRQMERTQREQMRRAETATTRYFSRQRANILAAFKGSDKESKAAGEEVAAGSGFAALTMQLQEITSPIARLEEVARYVDSMVDWAQDEEQVRQLLVNTWSSTYEKGSDIMTRLYDLKNPYKPEVRDIFKRMGGKKIPSDISGTTRSKIIDIIGGGLDKGESMEEIAQKISDCSELSPYRAQLIARQETYNSISAANFDTMKECGVRRHKWATTGKENVRMAHRKMNGQVREIGQPFSNGLLYPRDRNGTPEQVINCCCWAVPLRERNTVIMPNETR